VAHSDPTPVTLESLDDVRRVAVPKPIERFVDFGVVITPARVGWFASRVRNGYRAGGRTGRTPHEAWATLIDIQQPATLADVSVHGELWDVQLRGRRITSARLALCYVCKVDNCTFGFVPANQLRIRWYCPDHQPPEPKARPRDDND